ncbi:MAG TPA: type II toxin-antitoxin system HipA family toxin YjjJ [Steroidobacteraceae bacterium]|nr:type II toxin-antitoxin system HipA family toxin YjjJ [Steroidobacteraceae bacterium]
MTASATLENLIEELAKGPAAARTLARALRVSQPTLSRALSGLERQGRVIRIGTTRGARYGLARTVAGIGTHWPLFRVSESGRLDELGPLHALERDVYFAPRAFGRLRGVTEGIPYFLQDARPGGFLGRTVPQTFPELSLPARIIDWTDDHFLKYLTSRAPDSVGNLILGEASADRYMSRSHDGSVIQAAQRASRYPVLAASAMSGALAGSSAQGEQPKFLLQKIEDDGRRTHVLVKFSPPRVTEAGQRWTDLLLSEHLAHQLLARAGLPVCRSEWFSFGDRAYLEVERFDRLGGEGRVGAVSLYAIDVSRYGKLDSWSDCAQRLKAEALLSAQDADWMRLLDAFAQLIANTDRHFGNITLFDHYEGPFELAPTYDMLPMLFAPQHDQIIERRYEPTPPSATSFAVWGHARTLATEYWALLADEARLSAPFRALCARCLEAVRSLSVRGLS